ncbi:epoxide hydrolase [Plectosphaerella plurivora]|uniref:Epoxide hydrolase n=1 Tax=Plectosphaerella plurivora TaxID=936078 RepID=A0A9P9AC20_9PEZI|nr:epoxide hydrolase [Plectosphaerella plurivora]
MNDSALEPRVAEAPPPAPDAAAAVDEHHDDEIRPYRIHVSSKYLELTKRKLELTRLPHDVVEPKAAEMWEPKPQVEPLIDYWLEHFDWREQENRLNDALPQFRTSLAVPGTPARARLHFVHVSSSRPSAVPLLLLPPFPFTGLSLGHLVAPLTEPEGDETQPFNVVIPSLPGLGFSDALPGDAPAVPATASMLDALMNRLGYEHYIVSNAGSAAAGPATIDWQLATRLATRHASSCIGTHLVDPILTAPTAGDNPWEWTRLAIARFLNSAIFGYTTEDLTALARSPETIQPTPNSKPSSLDIIEPNTLAFALCDSPVGLLVLLLKSLRTLGPRKAFQPADIVTMAMLAWLPGPEAALRYWAHCAAHPEPENTASGVKPKVAVTVFLGGNSDNTTPVGNPDDVELANLPAPAPRRYVCPAWASRRFNVLHAARTAGEPGLVAWERPESIVSGIAALAKQLVKSDKRLQPVAPLEEVVADAAPEEPKSTPAGRDTLKPPPMVQHTSSETRIGDGDAPGDIDVASPKTLVTSPGGSPSPLPVKE